MVAPRTFLQARNLVAIVALLAGTTLLAPAPVDAHPEGGDPQTKSQQKCTNKVNSLWSKVSKATRKSVQKCLKNYSKGAVLTSNPGITTLEQCIGFDDGGKIQKTKTKTSDTFDKSCGGPARDGIDNEGFPIFPVYGVSTVPTVNAAGEQMEIDLIHDLFGADLDAGQMVQKTDPGDAADASKCQLAIAKSVSKCMAERQKQFLKCKKTHLKGPGIYGLIYDPDDLALCYDGMDPTKIMKKCDGIPGQGLSKAIQKQCADKVDDRALSAMFPACGTDDVAELATCLGERVACRLCLSANAADDANRDCDFFDDGDTDNNSCLPCAGAEIGFDSTYEAIQSVIFDSPTYGCSNDVCHGVSAQGTLDLRDDPNTPEIESYANLVDVPGLASTLGLDRVEPGEPALSFLYNKLLAGVEPNEPTGGGSPMPSGGAPALTPEHLEAVEKWIRGGAPEDLSVEGTAVLLGSCLPEADPLTIPIPDPPGAGLGVQFQQTPWPLPSQFEDEICMATVYDLTGTGLVPANAMVPCPPEFLPGRCVGGTNDPEDDACLVLTDCPDQGLGTSCNTSLGMVNNPTGACFTYKRQVLAQDPQSHHSIIHIYTGAYDHTDTGWGAFTYKFQDPNDPLEGTSCDPTAVDGTGQNSSCSGSVQSTAACLGYGPPDYTFGGGLGLGGAGGTAPQFSGSQEPYFEQVYPSGVYNILPMGGIIVWNSHAFNLTSGDSTMSQYLNLDFALGALEQQHEVVQIFDAASIFWQPLTDPDDTVPPFTQREFCRTFTIPPGAELFELGSHTHEIGVLWRTWGPPNTPCVPGDAACVPRGDLPLYLSTDYADPLQLLFDPPISHGVFASVADRTYLFCSLYDNGSGPGSPDVKRQSTSPEPPLSLPLGGPCPDAELECIGPNQGTPCFGFDSICESFPGAGDGDCDACPMRGGLTTKDEMFILLGNYFVP